MLRGSCSMVSRLSIALPHCQRVRFVHRTGAALASGKKDAGKVDEFKVNVNLDEIDEALKKEGEQKALGDDVDKKFMNFRQSREKAAHERSHIFTWKAALATLGIGTVGLATLQYMRKKKLEEAEKRQKIMAGKAKIGGPWELLNTKGELEGSEQLKGNWLLMYFGFTHCPDICPDEIEKMIKVVDLLESDPHDKIPVIPVFISVDPARDTIERVKEYCLEFSPKLRGYTGSQEQVDKVAKTFRVYYSLGPKTAAAPDDYIVDHSVIMYLMDPDGNFHDYYGQNRDEHEIAKVIKLKVMKYELAARSKRKGLSWLRSEPL